MNPASTFLALAAAVGWGVGDFAGGLASRAIAPLTTLASTQTIGFVGALVALAFTGEPVPPAPALVWASIAGLSGAIGLGSFYRALAQGAMSIAAPLAAVIGAVLPALVGVLRGEELGPADVLGAVAAIAAVGLISRSQSAAGSEGLRQLPLAVVAGLGFAGFYISMDAVGSAGGASWWPLATVRGTALVAIAIVVTLAVARGRVAGRPSIPVGVVPILVLSGLGDLAANLFFLLANAEGALSLTSVLSSLYPVVTVALAWALLGERLARVQLVGVALALAGIVLVAV